MASARKPSWMMRRSMEPATMSTEILQAQALLIMERIYLDIHLASLESQKISIDHKSTTPNTFEVTVERIVSSASKALKQKAVPCDLQLQRFVDLGKSLGWMLLSICSNSIHFVDAAAAANNNDNDDKLWKALYALIRSNAISIELFAKIRRLDWQRVIPPDLRPTYGGQLKVEPQDAHPYVVKPDTKVIYHPKYKTQKQRNIPASFYSPPNFQPPPDLRRHPDDGNCALCNNPKLCNCVLRLAEENPPLLELREYPERGIGVRSLRSIKAGTFIGQYVGEIRKPPVLDSTYALHHSLRKRSIGIVDAAIYGNWTRYMNHSCRAGVIFVSAVVGEWAYVLVRTIRDIKMFEEITVDYGDGYFEPRERVCRCREEGCRFKGRREGEGRKDLSGEEGAEFLPLYKSLTAMQRFL
ncbi:hypothetical protein EMCG_07668 [[Emmonsia] crescens]|uniref:SET domain-containing protein n=1 Tax=[Emmonsia] crescens TaxID=73230 RepID=A0A0G2J597_9EURO|nr:hypothetical protein EMCG_07668 [Emmonsia crescens UAMH 3008]